MDNYNLICKFCGGDLNIIEKEKSVAKCRFCGSKQTLPKLYDQKRVEHFQRANHFRRNCEFDRAEGILEQLLNEDGTDPEVYWSLVLCRYGIEYVEDTRTQKRIPTINRMQYKSILADEDYQNALDYATEEQKELYIADATYISDIQKKILEITQKEEPFDIFICYKETDENGKRTQDSALAQELYHELTRDGYRVFFSRVTLQGKIGCEFEPYIFAALNSAKVMIAMGSKPEYFEAVWVKNEWSRFLSLIKNGEKKVIIPAYRNMSASELPIELSHLQALDTTRLGFMQDLIEGVEKIIDRKKQQAPVVKESESAASNLTNVQRMQKTDKKRKRGCLLTVGIVVAILIFLYALGVSESADTPNASSASTDGQEITTDTVNNPVVDDTAEARTEPIETESVVPETDEKIPVKTIVEYKWYSGELRHKVIYSDGTYDMEDCAPADCVCGREYSGLAQQEDAGIEFTLSNGEYAVTGYTGASSNVDIPSTYKGIPVTSIGDEAFAYNHVITSITIPDSVVSIGDYVFFECENLKEVGLGNGVTSIGEMAFSYCYGIQSICIPDSTIHIAENAFDYTWLINVTMPTIAINCIPKEGLETVIITSGEKINDSAFAGCQSLVSVSIGDNVKYIGESAFASCVYLSNVTFGSGLEHIGDFAFFNCCNGLKSITIPNSVTIIGRYAFEDCPNLSYAIFENTSGWWWSDDPAATTGSEILSIYLKNSEKAAEYLSTTAYLRRS